MNVTLLIIHQKNQVLLGMKKRGFGEGFWNGFGGKIHNGESIRDAAIRECEEESGVTPLEPRAVGVLTFTFVDGQEPLTVYVFRAESYTGEPRETEEMNPRWFLIEEIPFDKMWPDDRFWFPLFFQKKKFTGTFLFNKKNEMLSHACQEVRKLAADVHMIQ